MFPMPTPYEFTDPIHFQRMFSRLIVGAGDEMKNKQNNDYNNNKENDQMRLKSREIFKHSPCLTQ
ncbi:CLUMA_CG020806, isoform A [Clunio marinus]|uniref:CLUMA_CG020806, isoform A n=1 Tax=Clunio marinus TaxID=568069 RepID=A0A1J1J7V4_9DIPT|nr:CLUMA_CG020806, isoform A [Clunio marinus]